MKNHHEMNSHPLKVHILQEYGIDFRPHATSYLRLLRPLTHPSIANQIQVTWGLRYEMLEVDAVVLDRLWHRYVSSEQIDNLIIDVKRRGAKLIYAIDDDLITLSSDQQGWPTEEHRKIVKSMLHQAAGVLVTTDVLRERFSTFNPNIVVVPNALDERLFIGPRFDTDYEPFRKDRITIGYMGTRTHLGDLKLIANALKVITENYPEKVEIQIVGVAQSKEIEEVLDGIPYICKYPPEGEEEYPQFMLWFSSRLKWDIALAPLEDTYFNQCKSDLKFLDYAAIGAAGIYSAIGPYNRSVSHLETGWLVKRDMAAWVDAIETLMVDYKLRFKIAHNAAAYLYNKRTLKSQAEKWLKAIRWILKEN